MRTLRIYHCGLFCYLFHNSQCFLLAQHTGITPGSPLEPYGVLGIEAGSATCKEITIPVVILFQIQDLVF